MARVREVEELRIKLAERQGVPRPHSAHGLKQISWMRALGEMLK